MDKGDLKQFLSSAWNKKGDLSDITAPPTVLATRSAVEFPATWASQPAILIAPALEEDPQKRALAVLKWYLSSLKSQQYETGAENEGAKKPLNPFLGELFIGQFEDEMGTTKLISEQVSHHPPVTACYVWNEKHGVRSEGYVRQEILFKSGTMCVNQIGYSLLHLDKYNEAYLVTLPSIALKNLLSGKPYPELIGSNYISSSTGFVAKIDYHGEGIFSGDKNSFEAKLYRAATPDDVLYTAKGCWNDKFNFVDVHTGNPVSTYDANTAKITDISMNDIGSQDPWESRKAWAKVLDAIQENSYEKTDAEKTKLEEAQRAMRKREEDEGRPWEPAFFVSVDDDPIFQVLAKPLDIALEKQKMNGVWKFSLDKAASATRPYHGGMTPFG